MSSFGLSNLLTQSSSAVNTTKVIATADGATAGIISDSATWAVIMSANANYIATLPPAVGRKSLLLYVTANGCELRTPALSGDKINGYECSETNELAIVATTLVQLECFIDGEWIAYGWSEAGAAIATLTPDAQ